MADAREWNSFAGLSPSRSRTFVAHFSVPPLTRLLTTLTFFSQLKMITLAAEKGDGKEFVSHAPGCWPEVAPELWNDWKWQLKNRVTSLAQLEQHLDLSEEERSGVLLSGDKLALAVTPHFFNLIPRDNRTIQSGVRSFHGSKKRGHRSTT